MKKLKLSNIDKSEVLSREELQNILDGESASGSHAGSGSGSRKGSGSKPGSLPPKIDACWGLSANSKCYVELQGVLYKGCCISYMASEIFCATSDTSCWT